MKNLKNQRGIAGIVEVALMVVVLGVLGFVGYRTYQARQTKPAQTTQPAKETNKSTTYSFKELGISMEIPDGWEVKRTHTTKDGIDVYDWAVEKPGADGSVSLTSDTFLGGFSSCSQMGDALTAATIKDVAMTQNPNLMFLSWTYTYDNEANIRTGIVRTDEKVFRTTNSNSAAAITNKDVKAGSYYFCISEPQAGFSLKLNKESAGSSARVDGISAITSTSAQLPTNAKSYSEIKTMLMTIK